MLHRQTPHDRGAPESGRGSRLTGMIVVAVLLASGFLVVGGLAEPLLPAAYPAAPKGCPEAKGPFVPRTVEMPGVIRRTTVLALRRDRRGVPRTPPLTTRGKWQFAWDKTANVRPGSRRGNVTLNAHTYPDGSALGNRLLRQLFRKQLVIVRGADGQRLCYRVTQRIKVSGDRPYRPYYSTSGEPQLAILVCSGRRRGPGDWSHRTIWYASPIG